MADIKGLMTSNRDDWETPQSFFDELHSKYNFTLDAASSDENAKLPKHYTRENSGLDKSWDGERVFCNPPYGSEIKPWARKCAEEAENGTFIVMLVPARTDTAWFHDNIYNNKRARFELLKGRLKFELGGVEQGSSTFPSMLVFFNDGSMDDDRETLIEEEIIRCRDCKYGNKPKSYHGRLWCDCNHNHDGEMRIVNEDGFCAWAERDA